MKNLLWMISFLFLTLIGCIQNKKENAKNKLTKKAFPIAIQKSIDSFIALKHQSTFGIFTLHISKKLDGFSLRLAHAGGYPDIKKYTGLPYSYEVYNDKLLLYYCGLELFQEVEYEEKEFIDAYKSFYRKYNMQRLEVLLSNYPELEIHSKNNYETSQKWNENYNNWFSGFDIELRPFVPPTITIDSVLIK